MSFWPNESDRDRQTDVQMTMMLLRLSEHARDPDDLDLCSLSHKTHLLVKRSVENTLPNVKFLTFPSGLRSSKRTDRQKDEPIM